MIIQEQPDYTFAKLLVEIGLTTDCFYIYTQPVPWSVLSAAGSAWVYSVINTEYGRSMDC